MPKAWPAKDEDEVLDYDVEWEDRLAGDTIATSDWTVPDGLTEGPNPSSFTTDTTKIWLQGGTEGATYEVLNRITTAGGRTMDQTGSIYIQRR